MRVRPDAAELLEAARATLLEEVLPALGGRKRYCARMVARAMAIAGRALAGERGEAAGEPARIAALLGEAPGPDGETPGPDGEASGVDGRAGDEARLRELNRRLAAELRAGTFAGDEAALRALLREQVEARLRLANPDYLERARAARGSVE